ncbi:ABC transporter ATP-binding protein [Oricola thermophila]|uniref:ABC transporter ATP-binding protein n=1 Tax=Oricola thermophila TaxID=2742145 RepID=A0A6N1VB06_9HYPH|nr:ABC transporter ATP-binding protein [Oricola thermophila]QKV18134.1 ABC transporter ATP-binding protein [Oricola thermophila]
MTDAAATKSQLPALLKVEGITKVFGALKANDCVDLDIAPGEIHALLGENGAGKSTLVKMLFGSLHPDAGSILWRGQPVTIANPMQARALGIGMVFQHFSLFESLSAAENIALSLGADVPLAQIAAEAQRVSVEYGLPIHPDRLVGELSVGERQRIEIVRCLLQKPELIILDEPTSVLTPQEADRLFATLDKLRGEGKSILYISHRLEEVQRLCDRATVLRHGKVVAHCIPQQETANSLATMMVGEEIHRIERASVSAPPAGTEPVLEIDGLSQPPTGPFSVPLENIRLQVYPGEVVGIAGIAGNGQSEFYEAVSGERPQSSSSTIRIRGTEAGRLGPSGRRRLGAAFSPEERLGHGAVPSFPLSQNLLLSRHASDSSTYLGPLGTIRGGALGRTLERIVKALDVRKSGRDPVAASLSGGNLQKLILGREFDRSPALLIANQPTWGVDAGAAARIRQEIIDLARAGAGVLVISQDLDELLEIADRIAVMSDGTLSKTVPADTVTRETLGLMMGGAAPERHHDQRIGQPGEAGEI